MFKRANKITSLLVAASAIVSIVHVTIVNASDSTRLGAKDGTIEDAIAYSDGKYVYKGYKSDDDNDNIRYNEGDKDKPLDNIKYATLNTVYNEKYAFANDGKKQYLIDLTNGDLTDGQDMESDVDIAAIKVNRQLKTTHRYGSDIVIDEYNLGYDKSADNLTSALPGNKYGSVWYSYKVKLGDKANTANNEVTEDDGNKYLYGFTDNSGKYIDVSNVANIYAYSTAKGKMVKINKFSNNVDDVDKDTKLIATLMGQPVVLTQDRDYIYALTKVAITDVAENARVTGGYGVNTSEIIHGEKNDVGVTTIRTYIQKISKDQGDKKDGAYIPEHVDSCEIGNNEYDGTEFDCKSATDAYNAIKEALGKEDLKSVTQSDVVINSNGKIKPKFTVVYDKLTVINVSTENIKATTIKLKRDNIKYQSYSRPVNKDCKDSAGHPSLIDEDYKILVYMAEKEDDDDVDINIDADKADYIINTYDIDANGKVWIISKGKIYEFIDNKFTKVYSTDGSLDQINVYDKNSLIAWGTDGDRYTTAKAVIENNIDKGDTGTTTTTAAAVTVAQSGWVQLANGTYNYYDETCTKVISKWVKVGGVWYYLKADGVMATGWKMDNDNGDWYYLDANGAMQTGWVNIDGNWYYFNKLGVMLYNTVVDGYRLDINGVWVK